MERTLMLGTRTPSSAFRRRRKVFVTPSVVSRFALNAGEGARVPS
jgi:hypothetical protein